MGALSRKLRSFSGGIIYWCPGCKAPHAIKVQGATRPVWQWDGNVDFPTVTPSVRFFMPGDPDETECHHFLKAGTLQFCGDSAHALAGHNVPLPDWPDDWD